MSDQKTIEADNNESNSRCEFLKKCGKGAVAGATAPAVTLLLAANTKPVKAADAYNGDNGNGGGCGCGS